MSRIRDSYLALFDEDPVSEDELLEIEQALGVTFPDDFREISKFYGGGYISDVSHHAIAMTGPASNIVEETQRLRESVRLPSNFVVLAEPPAGLIVLDCSDAAMKSVIWCDAIAVENLGNKQLLESSDTWSNYQDFFIELLVQEEEDRS